MGDTQLELMRPLTGYSIYAKHLERRGEGLYHLKFYYSDCKEAVADFAQPATRSSRAAGSTTTSTIVSIPTSSNSAKPEGSDRPSGAIPPRSDALVGEVGLEPTKA